MGTIWKYIFSVFNLERGLGYTMRNLTVRPGNAIKEFLFTERRVKHIKPMSFLILSVSISSYLIFIKFPKELDFNSVGLVAGLESISLLVKDIARCSLKYFNLVQMLKIPFISIGTFYVFRNPKLNFAEHLVTNSYIFSYTSIILVFLLTVSNIFSYQVIFVITLLNFAYPIFVYYNIFTDSLIVTMVKFFGIFFLTSILHLIFISFVVFFLQQLGFVF